MKPKKEEIKKLTIKYFIQQKAKEIGIVFGCVIGIAFMFGLLPYWLGHIGECINEDGGVCQSFFDYVNNGILTLIIIMVALFIVVMITYAIILWIKINWKEAKKRARKELR